jgi:predicted HAD superfamily Cof-like phosphohydrolase
MNKEQQFVKDFHIRFGYTVNDSPSQISVTTVKFRWSLIREEAKELREHMAFGNIIDISDALCDLLYVIYGTAVTYGIDLEPLFAEVHRSNMTKSISGNNVKKAIKGLTYSKPNLLPLLEAQYKENSNRGDV